MAARRRVLIADDHAPTRAGVRQVLEGAGFAICAEVADARAATESAIRERPDLCLLAVEVPGDSIEAIAKIRARDPNCAVVMLTASREDRHLLAAVRAGAAGYLLKDMDPERLPAALDGVLRGEAALPRALTARVLEDYRRLQPPRRLTVPGGADVELSRREWDVLRELRSGKATTSIADSLSISPVTVRRHISEIVRKLGVDDRDAAIRLAERTVEPSPEEPHSV